MPARLIAYVPELAARNLIVRAGQVLRIGRSPDAGFILDHHSVSRSHAELSGVDVAWDLVDLGSSNGSFVDDRRVLKARLPDSAWLRFGEVYCLYEQISDADAAAIEQQRDERRSLTAAHSERIDVGADAHGRGHFGVLLDDVLKAVLEIARCARGFVLLAQGQEHRVATSRVLDARAMASRVFSGSVGVVRRVLSERRAIVVNDVDKESWLAGRPSVVAGGLCSIVCLPLLDGDRLLGAIYLDRNSPGDPITAFDLELIGEFTAHAVQWLSASHAMDQVSDLPLWRDVEASHVPLKR